MSDLLVISGQTATGKTKLALDYAQKHNGELISADSRQVYKNLDIITGKDKETLIKSGVPTHLIDVTTPDMPFSSYDFVEQAKKIIEDIQNRNKTPVIVGGSYLYIKHLLYGQNISIPPNLELRTELEKLSIDELKSKLSSINKKTFDSLNNSDRNNPRRLIRKIEILNSSMKEVRDDFKHKLDPSRFSMIGLKHKTKEELTDTITKRVEKRLIQGALDEVRNLLKQGYKKTDPGLQTIGYTQLIAHLEGLYTLEEAKKQWISKEVQYAKRQYTFMKTDPHIAWKTV